MSNTISASRVVISVLRFQLKMALFLVEAPLVSASQDGFAQAIQQALGLVLTMSTFLDPQNGQDFIFASFICYLPRYR